MITSQLSVCIDEAWQDATGNCCVTTARSQRKLQVQYIMIITLCPLLNSAFLFHLFKRKSDNSNSYMPVYRGYFPWYPRQNHVLWGRLSLWKWVPGISPGVKVASAFGWRPTTLVVPKRQEIRGLNLPGTPWATSVFRGRTFLILTAVPASPYSL